MSKIFTSMSFDAQPAYGVALAWWRDLSAQNQIEDEVTLVQTIALIGGTSGNDTLTGTSGDDTLDGAAGADSMSGGAGNDTYIVDNLSDVVVEQSNQGIDTVISSVNYTLGANVENLTLSGAANLSGTGNSLANFLTGNSGVNTLVGGAGNDTITAALGLVDGGTEIDTLNITQLSGTTGYDNRIYFGGSSNVYSGPTSSLTNIADNISKVSDSTFRYYDGVSGKSLTFSGVEILNIQSGSDGNDLVVAVGTGTSYAGGAGVDAFYADWSKTTVAITWNGSSGNNVVTTSFERYLVQTGSGNDFIQDGSLLGTSDFRAGSGNDTIKSTAATIFGESGNDTVTAGLGSIDGGDGVDVLNISQLSGNAGNVSRVYFGGGSSYASYASGLDTISSLIEKANNTFRYYDYSNGKYIDFTAIEKLNIQIGSDANELVIAIGTGTSYAGGLE